MKVLPWVGGVALGVGVAMIFEHSASGRSMAAGALLAGIAFLFWLKDNKAI